MNQPPKKKIWILSDGLPGHVNQSIGVANALVDDFAADPLIINVSLRHKLLRPLMRLIANRLPGLLSRPMLSLFYRHDPLPTEAAGLIVSAGGNTLFANIAVAKIYRTPNVFSGTMKKYDQSLVRLILTVVPLQNPTNNLVLDLPPANVQTEPKSLRPAGEPPCYSVLIGGDGAGYHYRTEDWQQLGAAMSEISSNSGASWLLTTSRRTGEDAEHTLQSAVEPQVLKEAVWFAANPAKVVKRFLSESDVVFCTEDSLTMISEAIYAHKPVVTIQPAQMQPDDNDTQALDKYQRQGFIRRVPLADLAGFSLEGAQFCDDYPNVPQQIADAVRSILKLP